MLSHEVGDFLLPLDHSVVEFGGELSELLVSLGLCFLHSLVSLLDSIVDEIFILFVDAGLGHLQFIGFLLSEVHGMVESLVEIGDPLSVGIYRHKRGSRVLDKGSDAGNEAHSANHQ